MEIEYKFLVDEKDSYALLKFIRDNFESAGDEDKLRDLLVITQYVDDDELTLTKNRISMRLRSIENLGDVESVARSSSTKQIISVKWGGSQKDGLHRRNEVEAPIDDPVLDLPEEVANLVGDFLQGGKMQKLFTTEILRCELVIEQNESKIAVDIDRGLIFKDEDFSTGNVPTENKISEVEFELLSGREEDLSEFIQIVTPTFNMEPGEASKFSRGLKLYFSPEKVYN